VNWQLGVNTSYSAWTQYLPNEQTSTPRFDVSFNDRMLAEVFFTQDSFTTVGGVNFYIVDYTNGAGYSGFEPFNPAAIYGQQAEWIYERPGLDPSTPNLHPYNLPDLAWPGGFGDVIFDNAFAVDSTNTLWNAWDLPTDQAVMDSDDDWNELAFGWSCSVPGAPPFGCDDVGLGVHATWENFD
jgi:hypothetical protein